MTDKTAESLKYYAKELNIGSWREAGSGGGWLFGHMGIISGFLYI